MERSDVESAVETLQNLGDQLQQKILIRYHDDYDGPPLEKIEKLAIGDWVDLRSAKDVHLTPGSYGIIPLGISMKLPEGYEAHIVPRSSTFKRWGIIQSNHMGVIDNSYSGDGDIWGMPYYSFGTADIHKNDRICQFRIVKKMPPVEFIEVDHLDGADRGGFGSTGDK